MKVKKVSIIWVKNARLLLTFVYSNSKFRASYKDLDLNAGTSKLMSKRDCLNFLTGIRHLPW